jgi:hypothetical protein
MHPDAILAALRKPIDNFEEGNIDRYEFEKILLNTINELFARNTVSVEAKYMLNKRSTLKRVTDEQYEILVKEATTCLFQRIMNKLLSKGFIHINKTDIGYKQQLRLSLTVRKSLNNDGKD